MIVQPYTDGADRLNTAIIVSEAGIAADAFAELERLAERLDRFRLPGNTIEMLVVDSERRPVLRGH
jgi:hypothetical protein